jgi:hypothetical protein
LPARHAAHDQAAPEQAGACNEHEAELKTREGEPARGPGLLHRSTLLGALLGTLLDARGRSTTPNVALLAKDPSVGVLCGALGVRWRCDRETRDHAHQEYPDLTPHVPPSVE